MTPEEYKRAYRGSALEALMKASGHEICPKCYCCEVVSESAPCWQCGGFDDYEDYDDGFPPDVCSVCNGEGKLYWMSCIGRCDEQGKHERKEG